MEPDLSKGDDPVGRFLAGEPDAFAAIYRLYSPPVFGFALHMTGDRMKAAEITQDVFVWLIHHRNSFDPRRGGLNSFLTGVTRKLLLRHYRNERRWIPFREAEGVDSPVQMPAAMDSGGEDERIFELRTAIAALPPRYREAVVLCDLEGRSYEEAAIALECAVGTIRSRLHRARALLARKLLGKRQTERCAV